MRLRSNKSNIDCKYSSLFTELNVQISTKVHQERCKNILDLYNSFVEVNDVSTDSTPFKVYVKNLQIVHDLDKGLYLNQNKERVFKKVLERLLDKSIPLTIAFWESDVSASSELLNIYTSWELIILLKNWQQVIDETNIE
jgi:hypothetical protein